MQGPDNRKRSAHSCDDMKSALIAIILLAMLTRARLLRFYELLSPGTCPSHLLPVNPTMAFNNVNPCSRKIWRIDTLDFVNAYHTLAHVYIVHRLTVRIVMFSSATKPTITCLRLLVKSAHNCLRIRVLNLSTRLIATSNEMHCKQSEGSTF